MSNQERKNNLWKARTWALSQLAKHHQDEFVDLKNVWLVSHGEDPVDDESRHGGGRPAKG